MVIGIDFDCTINSMIDTWVEWLNRKWGTTVAVNEIKDWELAKCYPFLSKEDLFEPLNVPEFWDEVQIKPEAVDVIARLINERHEVYVVTSSHYKFVTDKFTRCLFAHFPFLTKENVIITYNKSLIKCDLLLDDGEHNFKGCTCTRVLFDAPYNQDATLFDYRVGSWKEFYILVRELSKGIYNRPPKTRVHKFGAGRGCGKTAWIQQMIKDSEQVPCYVIMPEMRYEQFCKQYLERFGQACPAKLYNFKIRPESSARFFIDTPSAFGINTSYFEEFTDFYLNRDYVIFVADFENVYWHTV